MKKPLLALLLATTALAACATVSPQASAPVSVAAAATPATTPAAEDARLLAFVDQAFDEAVAMSPQALTGLGIKQDYDKLDSYTDAQAAKELAFSEAKLAAMKASFDYDALSPAGQLTYRLFVDNVETGKRQYRWRSHRFPISTNGSPAGQLPVFLINKHRIDSVADAEAYVSRLRERRAGDGRDFGATFAPRPRWASCRPTSCSRRSAPTPRRSSPARRSARVPTAPCCADFKTKVGKLDAPAEVKAG